jgi:predicted MFS family arabinose efflux permease
MTTTGPAAEQAILRNWRLLAAVSFTVSFGFGIYLAVFQNFISERLGVVPSQLGILESLREVPGLLTAFVASALVAFAEPRLAMGALALSAIGIAATGQAPSFVVLVAFSVTWSVGMHLWFALQPSLTMSLTLRDGAGRGLGRMQRFVALANLLALALVTGIGNRLDYALWFLIAGQAILFGALICRGISPDIGSTSRPRLSFHPRFRLYYLLTMLEGCRRQIFITFATYALVREYHTPVTVIGALMFVNHTVTLLGAPIVGAWTDRLGERRMLTVYYVAVAVIFAGYATVHNPHGLYVLYCLDSLFFLFSVGLTTYLRRIAGSEDLTSSLMMGLTFNHVAAVAVPIAGGLVWERYGYENTFWVGVGIVALSLLLCRRLPDRKQAA